MSWLRTYMAAGRDMHFQKQILQMELEHIAPDTPILLVYVIRASL